MENKKALLENKRVIVGMKGHFWEVKGAHWLKGMILALTACHSFVITFISREGIDTSYHK